MGLRLSDWRLRLCLDRAEVRRASRRHSDRDAKRGSCSGAEPERSSPFYDDALTVCTLNQTGKIVPCNGGVAGIPPEGLAVTQQLSLVTGGVLKVTLPQGYYGGRSYDMCGASAPQADQQRYCPNG